MWNSAARRRSHFTEGQYIQKDNDRPHTSRLTMAQVQNNNIIGPVLLKAWFEGYRTFIGWAGKAGETALTTTSDTATVFTAPTGWLGNRSRWSHSYPFASMGRLCVAVKIHRWAPTILTADDFDLWHFMSTPAIGVKCGSVYHILIYSCSLMTN